MDFERKMTLWMACAVMFVSFGYLFMVTFVPVTPTGKDHSQTIVGFLLGAGLGGLFTYYWGTSKGSGDKSRAIEKMLGVQDDATPPPTKPIATIKKEDKP